MGAIAAHDIGRGGVGIYNDAVSRGMDGEVLYVGEGEVGGMEEGGFDGIGVSDEGDGVVGVMSGGKSEPGEKTLGEAGKRFPMRRGGTMAILVEGDPGGVLIEVLEGLEGPIAPVGFEEGVFEEDGEIVRFCEDFGGFASTLEGAGIDVMDGDMGEGER